MVVQQCSHPIDDALFPGAAVLDDGLRAVHHGEGIPGSGHHRDAAAFGRPQHGRRRTVTAGEDNRVHARGFERLERAVWAVLDGDSAEERVEITTLHPVELSYPRRLPVEARATHITSDGTDLGALVSFRRIDEPKTYERQLERQNEGLEQFADVVAHDLRNPLSVADGRLELLADEYDSEHIETVQNALGRRRAIIEETLTLAKQGRHAGEKSVVSLPDLFERCWETVETPGVRLTVKTDASAA